MKNYQYGWKFLGPDGCTEYAGNRFAYNLPQRGQKWSEWTEHPKPIASDRSDCGPGRLHVMRKIDARYAPRNWWIWYARWTENDVVSESSEKFGVRRLQLRRVSPEVFWRLLSRADLSGANLSRANLYGANLFGADLSRADLSGADLFGANLFGANLFGADLFGANLFGANLFGANLFGADLFGANLSGANLSGAKVDRLRIPMLENQGCNLEGVIWT
jgi:hypothetical protein